MQATKPDTLRRVAEKYTAPCPCIDSPECTECRCPTSKGLDGSWCESCESGACTKCQAGVIHPWLQPLPRCYGDGGKAGTVVGIREPDGKVRPVHEGDVMDALIGMGYYEITFHKYADTPTWVCRAKIVGDYQSCEGKTRLEAALLALEAALDAKVAK